MSAAAQADDHIQLDTGNGSCLADHPAARCDAAFDQAGAKFQPRSPGIPRSHHPLDGIDTDSAHHGGLSLTGASKERKLLLRKFACRLFPVEAWTFADASACDSEDLRRQNMRLPCGERHIESVKDDMGLEIGREGPADEPT